MCVIVDDPHVVIDEWPAIARCDDCGATERGLSEVIAHEAAWANGAEDAALALALNTGVPDWNDAVDPEWLADDIVDDIYPSDTEKYHTCYRCLEARRWLDVVCSTWIYGDYTSDIISHWDDQIIPRSFTFGCLVVACMNRWMLRGELLPVEKVRSLVDASLAKLEQDGIPATKLTMQHY
jgi:hypothetical protein